MQFRLLAIYWDWVFVKKKLEKGWNQEPAAGENFQRFFNLHNTKTSKLVVINMNTLQMKSNNVTLIQPI